MSTCQNCDLLREALKEISKGAGPYNLDPLKHCANTVEEMKRIAIAALADTAESSKEETP